MPANITMARPIDRATCPYCKGTDIITDFSAGDEICRSCAAVVTERLLCSEAEWRDYDNDDRGTQDLARCGGKGSSGDTLEESIMLGGNTALRKSLTRTYLASSSGGRDVRLAESTSNIHEICSKLSLSESVSVRRCINCPVPQLSTDASRCTR